MQIRLGPVGSFGIVVPACMYVRARSQPYSTDARDVDGAALEEEGIV